MNYANISDIDVVLCKIYDDIESLADRSNFEEMDSILLNMDVRTMSVESLIMVLSVTLPYKNQLVHREHFYQLTYDHLNTSGVLEEGLLTGLN